MSCKAMFSEIPAEHLSTALVFGITNDGATVLVEHKEINRNHIRIAIRALRERLEEFEEGF